MTTESQLCTQMSDIEADINVYLTEIEHNNRACTRLSQDTVEYHKKLESLTEMRRKCQTEIENARAGKAANVVRSVGGFCNQCGAPIFIEVDDGTTLKLRLCDKCLNLREFKGRVIL